MDMVNLYEPMSMGKNIRQWEKKLWKSISILLYKAAKNWTGPIFVISFKFFISQNTSHLMIYINYD
jgi:hypothetical protein